MFNLIINFILKFVLPVIGILIAFKIHILLGIAALVIYIGIIYIFSRDNFYAYRGNLAYNQSQLEEAIRWFGKASRVAFSNPQHKAVYGYLLLRNGQLEQAETVLNELNQQNNLTREVKMNVMMNIGLVHWKKNKLPQAIDLLETVHGQFKTTPAYSSLGYFYIVEGDLDKALEFNLKAHEFNNSDPVILDNLGQTYYLRGELDEAEKIYSTMFQEKPPKFPEPYFHYGQVLLAKNEREKALEWMEKGLEYPGTFLSTVSHEEIQQEIAKLK